MLNTDFEIAFDSMYVFRKYETYHVDITFKTKYVEFIILCTAGNNVYQHKVDLGEERRYIRLWKSTYT